MSSLDASTRRPDVLPLAGGIETGNHLDPKQEMGHRIRTWIRYISQAENISAPETAAEVIRTITDIRSMEEEEFHDVMTAPMRELENINEAIAEFHKRMQKKNLS